MESVIIIVLVYGGLYLLGRMFGWIGEWNERRKNRIEDEVALELLPQTDKLNKLVAHYKAKFEEIGQRKSQEYSAFWKDVMSNGRKTYRELIRKCPSCSEGSLRVIDGKYGKFLGCTSYPECRYTKNLQTAKDEYKEKSNKEFNELLNLAYKQ